MRWDHRTQPQEIEALRTPDAKLGNLCFGSSLYNALDADRAHLVAMHTKPVEHVAGLEVVVRRLERVGPTNHDSIVDLEIAFVHPLMRRILLIFVRARCSNRVCPGKQPGQSDTRSAQNLLNRIEQPSCRVDELPGILFIHGAPVKSRCFEHRAHSAGEYVAP